VADGAQPPRLATLHISQYARLTLLARHTDVYSIVVIDQTYSTRHRIC
jgi:hypothetical protein